MPYDGTTMRQSQDPILGRLELARSRLEDRRHWISGKYYEENGFGYQYCVLGAIAARPDEDGCMAHDADGRRTVVWLAEHVSGVCMPFEEAARVIYNFNDGNAAIEQVGRTVAGFLFMAKPGTVNGHQRVLDTLDAGIETRTRQLAAPATV